MAKKLTSWIKNGRQYRLTLKSRFEYLTELMEPIPGRYEVFYTHLEVKCHKFWDILLNFGRWKCIQEARVSNEEGLRLLSAIGTTK